jgi:hypothetical protein
MRTAYLKKSGSTPLTMLGDPCAKTALQLCKMTFTDKYIAAANSLF